MIIWGMSGGISSFVDHLDDLNKYKLITFDNRGTGRTDKPDEPYYFEIMAEDTIGIMNALDVKSAHFLGISMGSRTALIIAAKYPERVKSLILNVTAAKATHKDNLQSARSYGRLYAAMTQPRFLEAMEGYPPTVESFLGLFEAFKKFNGRNLLDKITAPTLIVNGTKDDSTPVKFTEELFEGISNTKLIFVEEDHLFIRTKPELLNEHAIEFLEEIDTKSALKSLK